MMRLNYSASLKTEFPANVGLVLQAYLKRTLNDIENMIDLNSEAIPLSLQVMQRNLC